MDIKKKGEGSLFIRTSPGRYTLRALATQPQPTQSNVVSSQPMSALATRKPAAPAPTTARPVTGRADSAEGGGYAS